MSESHNTSTSDKPVCDKPVCDKPVCDGVSCKTSVCDKSDVQSTEVVAERAANQQQQQKEEQEDESKTSSEPPKINLLDVKIDNEQIALNVIIGFLGVAQRRGVFAMNESAKIFECVRKFQTQ